MTPVLRSLFGSFCLLLLAACSLSSDDKISAKELKLVIEGPSTAAPGVATDGFHVTLTEGDNEAVEGVFVTLEAEQGTIDAPPNQPGTEGDETSGAGRVDFAFRPPADVTEAVAIKLTARAEIGGRTAEATYSVAVNPDAFQFTKPAQGASGFVGPQNGVPLELQWTRKQGQSTAGVSGNVKLSASGGFFVVNGSPVPASQELTLVTSSDASGNFSIPVAIASNTRGLITVTATDALVASRKAQAIVQFVDAPTALSLDASALTVKAAPDAARFVDLNARVVNVRAEPLAGVEVVFTLAEKISSSANERVTPSGGITNADGATTSKYEAGPDNGAAIVRACVAGSSICDSREITVTDGNDGTPPPVAASITLDADVLSVTASPNASRFSTLTARVFSNASLPMPGVQVSFTLTTKVSASVNERVSPTNLVTGTDGNAVTKYEAGPLNGAAVVQACVLGTTICSSRSIAVTGGINPTPPAEPDPEDDPDPVPAAP